MAKNSRRMRGLRNKVVQVRSDGDSTAAAVDRAISSFRGQESSCAVLIGNSFQVSVGTTGASLVWGYPQLAGTDDFVSLSQQFNTFKVKCMKFEVFSINPSVATPIAFSTVHSATTSDIPTTWTTEAAVVDAPDAFYLQPGAEKQCLYWRASGSAENEYQDVNSFINHGGFRSWVNGGTAQTAAVVVCHVLVVFRGRH